MAFGSWKIFLILFLWTLSRLKFKKLSGFFNLHTDLSRLTPFDRPAFHTIVHSLPRPRSCFGRKFVDFDIEFWCPAGFRFVTSSRDFTAWFMILGRLYMRAYVGWLNALYTPGLSRLPMHSNLLLRLRFLYIQCNQMHLVIFTSPWYYVHRKYKKICPTQKSD